MESPTAKIYHHRSPKSTPFFKVISTELCRILTNLLLKVTTAPLFLIINHHQKDIPQTYVQKRKQVFCFKLRRQGGGRSLLPVFEAVVVENFCQSPRFAQ